MKIDLSKLRALERRHAQLEASVNLASAECSEQRSRAELANRNVADFFNGGIGLPKELREVWHELRFDPSAALEQARKHRVPELAAVCEAAIEARARLAEVTRELRRERERFDASATPLARLREFAHQHDGMLRP